MNNVDDEDFIFVINALRRIDVMYMLSAVDFAKSSEIADILCMDRGNVFKVLNPLIEHNLVGSKKYKRYNFYFLTDKGKKMMPKLRDYHGIE